MKNQNGMPNYTYRLNRRCLYCDEPIADQVHKLRKHCFREVLSDGSVSCCKDDRHTEINSKINPPYNAIIKHHKEMHFAIAQLLLEKGPLVDLTDLNNYGIILNRPVEIRKIHGIYVYFYVGFKIKQIVSNTFKIETHDKIF
jgi:hypothetical protein